MIFFVKKFFRQEVFKLILKNYKFLFLSVFFDALFFFFFGFFTGLVKNRLDEFVVIIVNSIPSVVKDLDSVSLVNLLFSFEIKPFFLSLLLFIFLFYFFVFFVFFVFNGLAWWVSFIIAEQRSFRSFFVPFLKCCLFWAPVLFALHFLNLVIDLHFIIVRSFSPDSLNFLGGVFDVFFVLAAVFAFFSLCSLRVFGFFRINFKKMLNVILVSVVVLFVAFFVPWLAEKFSHVIALFLSFLLLLPGFLFIRVYSLVVLKKN